MQPLGPKLGVAMRAPRTLCLRARAWVGVGQEGAISAPRGAFARGLPAAWTPPLPLAQFCFAFFFFFSFPSQFRHPLLQVIPGTTDHRDVKITQRPRPTNVVNVVKEIQFSALSYP